MKWSQSLAAAGTSLAVGVAVGLYARFVEPQRLEVTTTPLYLPLWPAELDGVLVAFVADMHCGHRRGKRWSCPASEQALQAVSRAHADLLIWGGDYGFWNWDAVENTELASQFTGLERVAILGNHDYAKGRKIATVIRTELEKHGFTVLVNESAVVKLRGRDVVVAGLGDANSGHDDFEKLMRTIPAAHSGPVILLSHTPDGVDNAPRDRFSLALSGHTLGAQVAVPFFRKMILRRSAKTKYDRGLYDVNGIPLFVTRGLGMVGFHARFRSRPEVALLRLQRAR